MRISKNTLLILLIFLIGAFLRFYKLTSNPPSLYWEEVALSYDAYSLLKTGKDHRGNPWPLIYINSYMDYKPPLYVYAAIPSIAVFRLNEFGVRFPSALAGTLTVIVIYFLTKEIFRNTLKSYILNLTSLMASFLLAISPWHLQFSRAAFEANLALFIITLAIYLFLKSFKQKLFFPFSAVLFSLSLYTYHGARIFTPLILLILLIAFYKKIFRFKYIAVLSLLIGLTFSFPLLKSLGLKEINQRFQETSAFTSLDPIIESNLKINEDGSSLLSKLTHHRFFEYSRIFLDNYFKHFHGSFLFLSGDNNPRHSTNDFGLLYHWEIVSLITGLVLLLKNMKKESLIILGWLFIAIVPGAVTIAAPHALRTIFALPAYVIISALGLSYWLKLIKKNKSFIAVIFGIILTEFLIYFHFYYSHYGVINASQWQYGYKQAIKYVNENISNFDNIYITNNYGRAYMFYLFFSQVDPNEAQEMIKDQKNQPDINKLGKVFIGRIPDYQGKTLWVEMPDGSKKGKFLKEIKDLQNQPVFDIWETD